MLHQSSKLKQTCHRRIDTCSLGAALAFSLAGNFLTKELFKKILKFFISNRPNTSCSTKHPPPTAIDIKLRKIPRLSYSFVLIFRHLTNVLLATTRRKTKLPSLFLLRPHTRQLNSLPIYSWYTFVSQLGRISKMRRRENTKIKLCNLCFNAS